MKRWAKVIVKRSPGKEWLYESYIQTDMGVLKWADRHANKECTAMRTAKSIAERLGGLEVEQRYY